MKRIMVVIIGMLYAVGISLYAEDIDAKIHHEIVAGHLTIKNDQQSIAIHNTITAPDGKHYLRGSVRYCIGEDEYVTDTITLPVDNVLLVHGTKDNFLIPYALNGGGSGTFWSLGLFKADFVHHTVTQLDAIVLGDRIEGIALHSDSDGSWVYYKEHAEDQTMIEKPTQVVKKILTFDPTYTHITTPQEVSLSPLFYKALGTYAYPYDEKLKIPPFLSESLYLLGYSRDGRRLAYMTNAIPNEAGIIHVRVVVQDLVNDKILWNYVMNSGENPSSDITFEYYWLKNNTKISTKLNTFGIVPVHQLESYAGKISYYGDMLTYSAKNKKRVNLEGQQPMVIESSIYIHSKKFGTKKVYHYINKEEFSFELDIQPIGYFKLPNITNRIVLILAHLHRGHEGPPHGIRYELVGVSLVQGFNPKGLNK